MSERPRFVLERRPDEPAPPQAAQHALAPGETVGVETLCGEQKPMAAAWVTDGFTVLVYRISCHTCRERALAIVADWPAADPCSAPAPA